LIGERESSRLPFWFWLGLVAIASALLALAWWDWAYPGVVIRWWLGERIYPFYVRQLRQALILSAGLCLALWATSSLLAPGRRGGGAAQTALPFALSFLILPLFARYVWHPFGVQPGSSVWTYALLAITAGVATLPLSRLLRLLCISLCRNRWARALRWLLVITYLVVFGALAAARHTAYRSHALDLGTMDQAVWNTAQGRPLERTPLYRDPADGSRYENRLLDGKLELVLLFLAPLYGLRADPRLLLWVQTIALGMGGIAVYRLAHDLHVLGSLRDTGAPRGFFMNPVAILRGLVSTSPLASTRGLGLSGGIHQVRLVALLLTAAFLVYLPLHYVQMADFHPSALMVALLIAAWRAMRQGRWKAYYAWLLAALCCRIDAAFAALALGLLMAVWRPWVPQEPRGSRGNNPQGRTASSAAPEGNASPTTRGPAAAEESVSPGARRHGLYTLALAAAWLVINFAIFVPLVRGIYGPGAGDLLLRRFGALGDSPLAIVRTVLTSPLYVASALLQRDKLQVLFDLLAPAGFAPFLGPLALIPALPMLVINLLAGSVWQQSIHAHYMAPVIPFLWIAAVEGISATGIPARARRCLRGWPPHAPGWEVPLATFCLLCSLLVALLLSPFPPGRSFSRANYWQSSSYRDHLQAVIARVPEGASLCAQSDIHPHLAQRRDAALFPYCQLASDTATGGRGVLETEYVILDLDAASTKSPLDYHAFYKVADAWITRPEYGVVAHEGGVLLLQRGASRENVPQILEALDTYGREFYRVTYVEASLPFPLSSGDLYRVPVTLRNAGSQVWHSGGQLPVRLSYRWWTPDEALLLVDPRRTNLPHRVEPGSEVSLQAWLETPAEPGRYILEWDMVREGDAWFGDMGATMLRQEVVVE
jgi:uncharacterized membrane protein